jgi:hypothetical protein
MDIQAFLYPSAPTPNQALIKTAASATLTTFLIWVTHKPFLLPAAFALAGVWNFPSPEDSPPAKPSSQPSNTSDKEMDKAKKIAEAQEMQDRLQRHTIHPLFLGAHFASILCGAHYAWKASHLASTLLRRVAIPAYYSLPVFANTWMLIAYTQQIYDDRAKFRCSVFNH